MKKINKKSNLKINSMGEQYEKDFNDNCISIKFCGM